MFQLTPVTKNLLILNVGIFVIQQMFSNVTGFIALHHTESPYFYPFQILTNIFAHATLGHIFHNMLVLFFFGPLLERTVGDKKFLTLFMICGIGATFAHMVINEWFLNDPYILLGASGATTGVMIATAIFYPNLEVLIYFLFPIKIKYLALLFIAYDLYMGLSVANSGVAHFAHLGGALFAVVLLLYWKNRNEV